MKPSPALLVLAATFSCATQRSDACPPVAAPAATLPVASVPKAPVPPPAYDVRSIDGWTVHVREDLLVQEHDSTEAALILLGQQLESIVRVVPPLAVAHLRTVPLFFSPEYAGLEPKGEYHPDAVWLREHGRDPAMAKAIEFTDARSFARDLDRMPMLVLHELAHAYQDQVLGWDNAEIDAAYARAQKTSTYHAVERWLGTGQSNTTAPAYALRNAAEFFAENTEAFFGRNDYFPFTREELVKADPLTVELLARLWGAPLDKEAPRSDEPSSTGAVKPGSQRPLPR